LPQLEIISEREQAGGWAFDAQVLDDSGGLHRLALTLSWADYNLWSPDGSAEPQRVAAAVLWFLLSKQSPDELREKFDAALARKQFPDADDRIPQLI